MNRKRLPLLSLVFILLWTTVAVGAGTERIGMNGLKLVVNDSYLQETLAKENDRVLVPFRPVFNALGVEDKNISWDGKTRTVKASKGDVNVELSIDNKTALVNGKKIRLDQPARLLEGKTMVPVRFIAESFNLPVEWDGKSKTVLVNSEKPVLKPRQKITYDMPQKSINGKVYEKSYGSKFPSLGKKYDGADVVIERDLATGKERPVPELLDETAYIMMNVCHVDDTIWYVEQVGPYNNLEYNLVVFNPETKELIRKPLSALDIIRGSNLKNIDRTIEKLKKKVGPNAYVYGATSYGGALAHTEDHVYMHLKFYVTVVGQKDEYVEINSLARVRKSDLFIDLITEYKSNHIDSEELITEYGVLDYYDIDEDYYYVVDLNDKSKIYRIAHDGYELERVKK